MEYNREMVSVEVKKTFDITAQEWNNDIYIKMYRSAVTSGLLAALGANRWAVLCVIAYYMDEDGQCWPKQAQIAKDMGVDRKTANKYINQLVKFRWNDQPIIHRKKQRRPGQPGDSSVYTVLPISQLAIFNGKVEELKSKNSSHQKMVKSKYIPCNNIVFNNISTVNKDNKETIDTKDNIDDTNVNIEDIDEVANSNDIVKYFCKKYRERYSVNYSVSYGRDNSLIKNQLMKNYTPLQIKQIIDTVFKEYDSRWATERFPRPTIG